MYFQYLGISFASFSFLDISSVGNYVCYCNIIIKIIIITPNDSSFDAL